MRRRVQGVREIKTRPCGESSPFQDFMDRRPELAEVDVSVDVTRDWLPDPDHRQGLLDKIHQAIPRLTQHQQIVLYWLGCGKTFAEIASILKVSKGAVQASVSAIRKKIAG